MAANRRMLVIGASGFLGVHVVRAALAEGHDVIAAARSPRLPERAGAACATRVLDVLDPQAVERSLDEIAPTHVVLTAAVSRVDAAERDPRTAGLVNTVAPGVVASWAQRTGARLVHVSTDLVFGGELCRAEGLREDDPTDARSVYGRTKAAGEAAVIAADAHAAVVRLPLLHGESFGRGLGARDALLAALARGERPGLFTDEWRTPLDVERAARVLVRVAALELSGLWHAGGPERLDRYTLGVRCLGDAGLERPEQLVTATTRAAAGAGDRPRDVSLDSSRLRARLGAEAAELLGSP